MIQNNTLQLIVFQYDSTLEEYQVAVALEKPSSTASAVVPLPAAQQSC